MSEREISITEIEARLKVLPKEINAETQLEIKARVEYLKKKAEARLEYSKSISNAKIQNPEATQTDLKAIADEYSHQLYLDMIILEANYQTHKANAKMLDDEFTALKRIGTLRVNSAMY